MITNLATGQKASDDESTPMFKTVQLKCHLLGLNWVYLSVKIVTAWWDIVDTVKLLVICKAVTDSL